MDREKFLEITKTAVKHGTIFYAKNTTSGHWLGIFNKFDEDSGQIYSFVNFFYPDINKRDGRLVAECYTHPDNVGEIRLGPSAEIVDFRPATKAECNKFYISLQLAGLKWCPGIDKFSFVEERPTSLMQVYELPDKPFVKEGKSVPDDGIISMAERGHIYGEVRDLLDHELHSFKMKVLDLIAEKLKLD